MNMLISLCVHISSNAAHVSSEVGVRRKPMQINTLVSACTPLYEILFKELTASLIKSGPQNRIIGSLHFDNFCDVFLLHICLCIKWVITLFNVL